MKNELEEKGNFEIFQTTEGNELLRLGKNEMFAIVETNRGHILVKTDEDHKKEKTLQKGEFKLVDFKDDPSFQDMPHLFLKKGSKYEEMILPRGLPDDFEKRKKIIFSDDKISGKKISAHLKNKKKEIIENEDLQKVEKKELDRMARKMNIEGRSKMNKKELAKAIDKAKS